MEVASRAQPHQTFTLQSGQSIRLDSEQLHSPETASPFAASWAQARLVYQDASLTQVINDLGRYRSGFLKINEQAAQLRFTGVLPADDPEAALNILQDALPIHIWQPNQWLVWIKAES